MATRARARTGQSKSRTRKGDRGRTLSKSELAKIKRGVAALKLPTGPEEAALPMRALLAARRRALTKTLGPMIAKGLDLKKAAPLLAQYNHERAQNLKKRPPILARAFVSAAKARRARVAATLAAPPVLGIVRPDFHSVRVSLAPFLIKSDPSSCLFGESYAPGNAWARLYYYEDSERPRYRYVPPGEEPPTHGLALSFYYMWPNERDTSVTVNVSCAPWFIGRCAAQARAGFFSGGDVSLTGITVLHTILWNRPDPLIPDSVHTFGAVTEQNMKPFLGLNCDGSILFGSSPDHASRDFNGGYDLRYDSFDIPARTFAVFRVNFVFTHYEMEDADVLIDFGYFPEYSISIPSVDLDIYETSAVTGGPYGTVAGVSRDG